jgi:hypothetical protein
MGKLNRPRRLMPSARVGAMRPISCLSAKRHPDRAGGWLVRVASRRNPNIAAVALANKNARVVWAMLAHGRDCQVGYRSLERGACSIPLNGADTAKRFAKFIVLVS